MPLADGEEYAASALYEYDHCGPSDQVEAIRECTNNFLNTEQLEADYQTECQGKTQCNLNLIDYVDKSNVDTENVETANADTIS